MRTVVVFSLLLMLFSSNLFAQTSDSDYCRYVNPFIGTERMGHTFPGAAVPFGMVQLSPDTDTIGYWDTENNTYNRKVYEYCAGYQYEDNTIVGFSHTHFSGTGHSDLGDFLIMPNTGELKLTPGTEENPDSGFRSRFSHEQEAASPAYYIVELQDYNITAELTATERVGFHKYTFPEKENQRIILDLVHGIYSFDGKNVWTFVRVENDTLVTGYRQTHGWARTKTVYFAMAFDKPIKNYGHKKFSEEIYNGFYRKFNQDENFPEMAGHDIRAYFEFDENESNEVQVKFALSSVSTEGAILNLQTETPNWDFDQVRKEGQEKWNRELSKIHVETMTEDQKIVFYTAMYHSFLAPVEYMDVDGKYRGLDQNIHTADGFTNYTIFSLWDTYRALHPLFNLVQPERNSDMAQSMVAHFNQSVHPMLPVWSHYSNENWCMIGYHSVPVIADLIMKDLYKGDIDEALHACATTAKYAKYDGLGDYMELGYVPADRQGSAVSKTLEYAYDDWTIMQIAEKAGNKKLRQEFAFRAENYKNTFNPKSGYMHPRNANGDFREIFDPLDTHGQGFIEGNAWNYGLYVPHNVDALVEMKGGKKAFASMLDTLFTMHLDDAHIAQHEDITRDGIIGLYVHGNEPGHHIPYLYNAAGKPEKTQEKVRMILDIMYTNDTDGLCGNDDCGQMSAWYIFSAMGFYPVCPASNVYALGSPLVRTATVELPGGKYLYIKAENQASDKVHVKKVTFNGEKLEKPEITWEMIKDGGELVFYMKK